MRRRHVFPRLALVVVIAVLFTFPGCAKRPAGAGGSSAVGSSGQMPTDEEARQFAKTFEANMKAGDLAAVNSAIDWDAILNRSMAGIEAPDATKENFAIGAKTAIRGIGGFASHVMKDLQQGGDYKLLRIHRQDGQQRALFRFLFASQAVTYHDVVIVRQADGKVRGDDIYIYASGDMFSETLHRGFVPVAAEANKSLLARMSQQENDYIKNLDKIRAITGLLNTGDGKKAMEIYDQLPDSLKTDKNILFLRVRAAGSLGPEQKDAAVRALRSACPHDPSLDLLLIDSYCNRKQYAKARAALDRLDRSLGGDPYLDILRASSFTAEGDNKTAKEHFRKAIAAEDNLAVAYFNLIAIAAKEKDFDEMSRLLTVVRRKFPKKLPNVAWAAFYADFRKSTQGQAWLKTLDDGAGGVQSQISRPPAAPGGK